MKAEVMLNALSDERWNWIIQGKIEGQERDIRSGLANAEERGLKRGIVANKIENAKNLLAMGLGTHEQISQAIGLPIEKIEALAKEIEAKA